ncbi:MAG: flotillin family protein [Proteobacteria bacterium]|nr:flotillin family protein [Pseudomonadota bacterium]
MFTILAFAIMNLVVFGILVVIFVRGYHRCPPGKVLVIYGKMGRTVREGPKCITKGVAFVWPFIQSYCYLDLTASEVAVNLRDALTKENDRVDVSATFTVGISTKPGVLQNAAERILGLDEHHIASLAKEIIQGQIRLICASRDSNEVRGDEAFVSEVNENVERELNKIGLTLINAVLNIHVVPKRVNLS